MDFHSYEWKSDRDAGPDVWHTAPMGDTGKPDPTDDGPSLEMPSFSLRRRKRAPEDPVAPEPTPGPEPAPAAAAHEPAAPVETVQLAEPAQPTEPVQPVEPTQPVEPPTAAVPVVEPETAPEPKPAEADHREPRQRRELPLSGLPAAAVTGVVVGGLAVLLAWLATTSCEAVRGTSSCGGGPGLLILVAVLVLLAYAGSWLLRLFGVAEPGSTSMLAVGIMAVLVMVFLLGSTDEWWMAVALPVVTVVAYCASWWVTASVRDDDAGVDAPEPHDVR